MQNQLLKEANEFQEKLSAWRRALHQIPEIGLHLPKTVAFVKKSWSKWIFHIPCMKKVLALLL